MSAVAGTLFAETAAPANIIADFNSSEKVVKNIQRFKVHFRGFTWFTIHDSILVTSRQRWIRWFAKGKLEEGNSNNDSHGNLEYLQTNDRGSRCLSLGLFGLIHWFIWANSLVYLG